jgi:hypothetical protein
MPLEGRSAGSRHATDSAVWRQIGTKTDADEAEPSVVSWQQKLLKQLSLNAGKCIKGHSFI